MFVFLNLKGLHFFVFGEAKITTSITKVEKDNAALKEGNTPMQRSQK